MTNWKISRSTVMPDEVDISSSKTTIYVRKNIRQVDAGLGEEKIPMFEYEEKKMTKEEFVAYADILENIKRSIQNKADIANDENALLELDSVLDSRMAEIENCILELDCAANK